MTSITPVPTRPNWTTDANCLPLAYSIVNQLAQYEVDSLSPTTIDLLRAAATELVAADHPDWTVGVDDPPIALIRMITLSAAARPEGGGPDCIALLDHLL